MSVLLQMNWEENQVVARGLPGVENYPSIYLFPANNKTNPIPYNGARWVRESRGGWCIPSVHDRPPLIIALALVWRGGGCR